MAKVLSKKKIKEMISNSISKFKKKGMLDLHTHLFPLDFGDKLCLLGPDATIDYHYLYGEALSDKWLSKSALEQLWNLPRAERVDWIIKNTYGDGCLPISEGRGGPLTIAHRLGLDTSSGNMAKIIKRWRTMYQDLGRKKYLDKIFSFEVKNVICTNSIFEKSENYMYFKPEVFERWDQRFQCGLRLDEAIHKRDSIGEACEKMGFSDAALDLGHKESITANRKLMEFWINRLPNVRYAAVSLSPDTDFKNSSSTAMRYLEQVMIPTCRERGLPIALMPFVRRQINPLHKNAGDVVARGDVNGLIDFISHYLDVKFLVTPLHDNDNYDLSFATRALGNIRLWGHWWCNLNPVLIKKQLKLRLENNGYAHFGINTDSRIPDQLLYKVDHYMEILAEVLLKYCLKLQKKGVVITEKMIYKTIVRLQDSESLLNQVSPCDDLAA